MSILEQRNGVFLGAASPPNGQNKRNDLTPLRISPAPR